MNFNSSNAQILVLSEDGTNLGKMSYRDAEELAIARNLDLVSVNHVDGVEVFKIMDHGKWKYEKKKHKQKKSNQPLKEMGFKVRIDIHDQNIKVDRIKGFLEKGSDVKISVQLRGREKSNPRQATDKLNEIIVALGEDVQVQQQKTSNSMAFAVVRPVKLTKRQKNAKQERDGGDGGEVGNSEAPVGGRLVGHKDGKTVNGADGNSEESAGAGSDTKDNGGDNGIAGENSSRGGNGSDGTANGNINTECEETKVPETQNKDTQTSASNERRITV